MKNKNRLRYILLCTFLVATTMIMTGCTTFENFKSVFIDKNVQNEEDVVYIGVYEPQSGELRQQGEDEIKGIELAHSLYNNVNGVSVRLITVDNQSDVNAARAAIENLIKMEPVAIIGSAGEVNSMVASPYIEKAAIPTITPSATNPLITDSNDYYFRACMTGLQRGAGLAEYAFEKLGTKKVGIVATQNDSAIDELIDGFTTQYQQLSKNAVKRTKRSSAGGEVVLTENVRINDFDAKSIVDSIAESEAEAILLPLGTEQCDAIFSEAEKAGLADKVTFLGIGRMWDENSFIAMKQKHPKIKIAFTSDSVLGEGATTTGAVTAETQRFLIEYGNMYGDKSNPSENAALGYDSYLLLINAMNQAQSFDPKDIRDALANIEGLRCATGVFSFSETGTPIRSVNIATLDKDIVVTIYEASAAADMTGTNN